ncbi:MAG: PA2817 family protein [Cellvibrionaceae bacterium]
MSTEYFQFHQSLLKNLYQLTEQTLDESHRSQEDQTLIEQLAQLSNANAINESFIAIGQQVICRIVAAYPHIAPQTPRDLFWLFGGDCLHYMPDEEIAKYQRLDELRFDAEDNNTEFDYEGERARILGLH